MIKKTAILLSIVLVTIATNTATNTAVAQNKQEQKEYNEKVVVVAPYNPSIELAKKPVVAPTAIVDTARGKNSMSYEIVSRPIETTYPIENIKPAKVTGEPIAKLFNQHIKIGFGTHLSPLAEAYFAMGRSQQYGISASYKHLSSYGNIKNYSQFKTDNSINEGDLSGEIYAKDFKVRLDVGYSQRKFNCYGLSDGMYDSIGTFLVGNKEFNANERAYKDNPVRWYQNTEGTLRFDDRAKSVDDWHYDAQVYYNFGRTVWRSMENILEVDGGFSKRVITNGNKVDKLDIGARLSFGDYMHRPDNNYPLDNSFTIRIEPTVSYRYGIFELDAALRFYVYGDAQASSKFQFSPAIKLNIHAVKDILNVFVGIDGNVKRNTITSISELNPFLHPLDVEDLRFTKEKFIAYAGIKSSFSKNIDFILTASTRWLDNKMSFDYYYYEYPVSSVGISKTGYNDFKPYYLDKVFQFNLKGELNMRWDERIFAHVEAEYNYYNKKLLYTPAFEARVMFRYNIGDKFIVTSEIAGYTNMKAHDRAGNEVTIKGGFDWSAGLEYRFFKRWSAFVNLSNIISQRYYKWYDYPTYRFNLMAGLTFSF